MTKSKCKLCHKEDVEIYREWIEGHDRINCKACGNWWMDPPLSHDEMRKWNTSG